MSAQLKKKISQKEKTWSLRGCLLHCPHQDHVHRSGQPAAFGQLFAQKAWRCASRHRINGGMHRGVASTAEARAHGCGGGAPQVIKEKERMDNRDRSKTIALQTLPTVAFLAICRRLASCRFNPPLILLNLPRSL
jgi:hypothetical protein